MLAGSSSSYSPKGDFWVLKLLADGDPEAALASPVVELGQAWSPPADAATAATVTDITLSMGSHEHSTITVTNHTGYTESDTSAWVQEQFPRP